MPVLSSESDFSLSPEQNRQLDAALELGQFSRVPVRDSQFTSSSGFNQVLVPGMSNVAPHRITVIMQ